jgi:hypothetical protein
MITPKDLATIKPGLDGKDWDLDKFLHRSYDHATQMRNVESDGAIGELYPTSTRFDGDRT